MTEPSVDAQLDEIWARARPRMLERVDAIERAIDALDGERDPDVISTGSPVTASTATAPNGSASSAKSVAPPSPSVNTSTSPVLGNR